MLVANIFAQCVARVLTLLMSLLFRCLNFGCNKASLLSLLAFVNDLRRPSSPKVIKIRCVSF